MRRSTYDNVTYTTNIEITNGTLAVKSGNNAICVYDGDLTVTVLWTLEGSPAADSSVKFDDVADGLWYSDAISWASANAIVNGYGDGNFGLTSPITREQIMAILNVQ